MECCSETEEENLRECVGEGVLSVTKEEILRECVHVGDGESSEHRGGEPERVC